ncbi:cytidylate kinase [Candidatus Methylomirabilis lanthanidiphila]|uniref:Cytidylate kinase n=1 Tax=Candidatus Methylomirabilis lanthanidiphila TaxID=2211376 RepID=A0A564ZGE2_9BACT|nr:cytidylate kinase [Candidatus Methylomirabilis lanthanidiphila]
MQDTMDSDQARGTKESLIVAIDGPVGAGKSTAARLLSRRLGYRYIDSGAMYRALSWKALRVGLDLNDEQALRRLADNTSIVLQSVDDRELIFVDGQDVSRQIREREVEQATSRISTHPSVRCVMVAHQRQMAAQGGVVMDGRDIGTVVFPDAHVKFFLTARLEVRATRRYLETQAAGASRKIDQLAEDIQLRDTRDMSRRASPLRKAEEAVTIDTSDLAVSQVVDVMETEVRRKIAALAGDM